MNNTFSCKGCAHTDLEVKQLLSVTKYYKICKGNIMKYNLISYIQDIIYFISYIIKFTEVIMKIIINIKSLSFSKKKKKKKKKKNSVKEGQTATNCYGNSPPFGGDSCIDHEPSSANYNAAFPSDGILPIR